ncbi:MAG: NADH-quinone oxidoreductase subunit N [Bacteroidia bacterium]
MNTLILTTILGLLCMVMEIFNLRKLLVPVLIAGLCAVFYVNYTGWELLAPVSVGGINMDHMMQVDHFSMAFSALSIFLTAMIILMGSDFYRNEQHHLSDYLSIIVFILCGTLVLFSFNNLAMLFLGIEIVSISLYIMAGSKRFDLRSNEAGFKYFLMGAFASGFLLFGIALVYGSTGSFELAKISTYVEDGNLSPLFYAGCLLIIIALLFKVAAVPFHFWSPDVYEGSPALVTALMSTLVKVSLFAAFYRLLENGFFGAYAFTTPILMWVTAATLILGNLTALFQENFKRMLAYSGISHAGYMLMGVMSMPAQSESALFFYASAYAIASIGVFAVAIPVFLAQRNEGVNAFNGLGKRNPLLAALLTICMLSVAGIPPFAGFLAKYYIFSQAFQSEMFGITLLAVITSIIAVYYYFRVIVAMYTKEPNDTEVKPAPVYWIVLWICVALSIVLGIFPDSLMQLLS